MREVFFVIGRGDSILWSDASSSEAALPDSRARWEAIWRLRADLEELAHSHPAGLLGFSHEDETTMTALVDGLGREVRFSVVAPAGMIRRRLARGGQNQGDERVDPEPWWASLLRHASGMMMEGSWRS